MLGVNLSWRYQSQRKRNVGNAGVFNGDWVIIGRISCLFFITFFSSTQSFSNHMKDLFHRRQYVTYFPIFRFPRLAKAATDMSCSSRPTDAAAVFICVVWSEDNEDADNIDAYWSSLSSIVSKRSRVITITMLRQSGSRACGGEFCLAKVVFFFNQAQRRWSTFHIDGL